MRAAFAFAVTVLVFVACSPQAVDLDAPLSADVEFEPYPGVQWYAPGGEPVPEESKRINAITGPEHCDWQSGVILHLRPEADDELKQYFRDPQRVFPQNNLMASFDDDVELPESASYTGYRTHFMELWLDENDDSLAYLVFADHVEQWPASDGVIACG